MVQRDVRMGRRQGLNHYNHGAPLLLSSLIINSVNSETESLVISHSQSVIRNNYDIGETSVNVNLS